VRNSLTITLPHFQIEELPYAPGNHVSNRDRDFRPTRRDGFDDDNFETPRRSFGSTPGSSAQRFEATSGPPVQAVVKWYNPDKGLGVPGFPMAAWVASHAPECTELTVEGDRGFESR
jgi:hypothetical protein